MGERPKKAECQREVVREPIGQRIDTIVAYAMKNRTYDSRERDALPRRFRVYAGPSYAIRTLRLSTARGITATRARGSYRTNDVPFDGEVDRFAIFPTMLDVRCACVGKRISVQRGGKERNNRQRERVRNVSGSYGVCNAQRSKRTRTARQTHLVFRLSAVPRAFT